MRQVYQRLDSVESLTTYSGPKCFETDTVLQLDNVTSANGFFKKGKT